MARRTKKLQKQLDNLPPTVKVRAEAAIQSLSVDPYLGKKLKGPLEGKWSFRVGRSYRIIYQINNKEVIVLSINPRKDSYR